jgi:small GTP-binding protein
MSAPFQAKVTIIGDVWIGKTCLMNALLGHDFNSIYIPTTGPEFRPLHFTHAGQAVRLQMWDTAGQEAYRAITRMYFRNSHIVLLCYQITQQSSFDSIESWLEIMGDDAESAEIILVGTKRDLADGSATRVTSADLEAKAQKFGFKFIETSARTNEGIEELKVLLGDAALTIQQMAPKVPLRPPQAVAENDGGCC